MILHEPRDWNALLDTKVAQWLYVYIIEAVILLHERRDTINRSMFAVNTYRYLPFIALLCTVVNVHSEICNVEKPKKYDNNLEDPITLGPQLISALTNFLKKSDHFGTEAQPDVMPANSSHYDFIVVGSGSAGSVVASRLSEVKEANILVIEAGDEEELYMDIPLLAAQLQTEKSINWAYETEPSDKYCLGLINHQCKWPRGKVMGGSSVLNFMIATRGNKKDFDNWAAAGNEGWSYKDILPFFKKLENMHIPHLAVDTRYHSTKGPLSISSISYRSQIAKAFIKAAEEMGFRQVDINGESTIGVSYVQATIDNGTRMSTNKAYLHSKLRKNLHVTKRSLASKILIDSSTKRAYGVQYTKDNVKYTVYAKKEVILSAGAIGSPQLLMLSGVGPGDHLREQGIEVIKDAPVGKNLQDHIFYNGLLFTVNQSVGILSKDILRTDATYLKDYLKEQTGPFEVPATTEALMFTDVYYPNNRDSDPNIEQCLFTSPNLADPTYQDDIGLKPEIRKQLTSLQDHDSWMPTPILLRPKSVGWLKLRSSNINDHPIIVPNYLDHPDDIKTLAAGIKQAFELSKTNAMQKYNSTLFEITLEGCEEYKDNPDKHLECYMRHLVFTTYHHCGTCKMGRADDPTAVLNPKLQVIGIEGLRVVDASAMPTIPSAHTNIPTCMMAEKLSDMVKDHWGYT